MTDVSIADDEELLDLLAESGCVQILIGFESPDGNDLKGINENDWKRKRAANYLEVIEKIQSRGITVSGCFVLGLDEQDTTIFERVREFIVESKLLESFLAQYPPSPVNGTFVGQETSPRRIYSPGSICPPLCVKMPETSSCP